MASSGVIAGCRALPLLHPPVGKARREELAAGVLVLSLPAHPQPRLCQLGDYCEVLISESEALWDQALKRPSYENLWEGSLATCGSHSPGASVRLTTAAPTRDLGASRIGSSAHPAPRTGMGFFPLPAASGHLARAAARFFNSSHFTEEKTVVRDGLVS